jgi:carbon-monoxide dehydrogenase large subunit
VLAQIAADALQIPVDHIAVVQGDTRQVQAGHGTFNSRSMAVGGSSVTLCASRIVAKAKKIAAMMGADEKDVAYEGGRFSVVGTDISLPFAAVARMAYLGHVLPAGLEPGLDVAVLRSRRHGRPVGCGAAGSGPREHARGGARVS